ncbi:hypothetical protein [Pseudomonas sp. L13]|uniref:hypothetical protein n=1 Tax=Pseudomonas sp. L13 TaxID=343985 RepID=UPI00137A1C06|nr:hypothetical protein [Pseudomonas sp. L13]NCE89402.1 hypothetical protein [Pseudomonas sp. L13]
MSKGIKMLSAVDAQGVSYTVDELQTRYENAQSIPILFCDDDKCRHAVRFVKWHTQDRKNRVAPVQVPAYIGLSRGSEHVLGCRYDAPGRLKLILAAASDPNFMHALDDGKRELRLLILHQGLQDLTASGNAATPAPPPPGSTAAQRPTGFRATKEQLDSYLRTTTDLLALRAACEDDELLAANLTLKLGKHTIAWHDFLYESGRYDEVWDKLAPDSEYELPLALIGTVRSHKAPPAGATYTTTYLNCESQLNRTDDPNRREYFEVSVSHAEDEWLRQFLVDSQLIMFGLWKRGATSTSRKPHPYDESRVMTYVTHKLRLSPMSKRQLAALR